MQAFPPPRSLSNGFFPAELLGPAASVSVLDRRAAVRYPTSPTVSCQTITSPQEVTWPAIVLDISTGGIGLVLAYRFDRGTPLHCELRNAARTLTKLLRMQVVHVIAQDDCWVHGCAFVEPLNEDELQAFL